MNRPTDLHVRVSADELTDLDDIARALDLDRSKATRHAIRAMATMVLRGTPICANGQVCRCPTQHAHVPATAGVGTTNQPAGGNSSPAPGRQAPTLKR